MKWLGRGVSTHETPGPAPSDAEVLRELDRVVNHPTFRKSENLCHILAFLAEESLKSPGVNHKEHEIATRALGRTDDFDPRLDSTVRVHTARLRTKLSEYYAGDGEGDAVLFEIPKGAYQLNVRLRDPTELVAAQESEVSHAAPSARWRDRAPAFVAGLLGLIVLGTVGWFWLERRPRQVPPALRTFWAGFLEPGADNAVVFSTPRFVGPVADALRFAPPGPISPELLIENYAGTGEVYGVGALAGFFGRYAEMPRIKRGRLLTWDDARHENLIFVGGPNVNLQLGELPELQRFRFNRNPDGSFVRESLIRDFEARGPQTATYGHSSRPYTFDHAVIALMRFGSNRKMLLLAGTITMGTQASVDYVVREDTVQTLLAALKVPAQAREMPGFEVLLRVKVSDGVPVDSRVLAVHLRK